MQSIQVSVTVKESLTSSCKTCISTLPWSSPQLNSEITHSETSIKSLQTETTLLQDLASTNKARSTPPVHTRNQWEMELPKISINLTTKPMRSSKTSEIGADATSTRESPPSTLLEIWGVKRSERSYLANIAVLAFIFALLEGDETLAIDGRHDSRAQGSTNATSIWCRDNAMRGAEVQPGGGGG